MYKKRGFHRRFKGGDLGKSKVFGFGGVLVASYTSTTLQEVGFFPTLVYLYLKGLCGGCFKWLLYRCPKGLFGPFLDSLWPFLWPICGRFCWLICECLWHVQSNVLGAVLIKNLEQFNELFS